MPESFVSPVDIANMALSHVGAKSAIESLDEKTAEATQARIWYDYSRRVVLEAHNWHFARKRVTLALHGDTISETSTDPMAGVWGFRYQYPPDCLVARKIQNPNAPPDDAVPFTVEGSLDGKEKTILTSMEDAVLVYTWNLENTDMFSSLFVLAMSHLLAHHVAYSLTGSRRIKVDELKIFQGLVPLATGVDANEGVDPPPRDTDWIRARQ
ncbi:hypothetical protein LCGC14_0839150 [marine sediment metagenome]|uniref:Uncharacterized protein n=1 Tax=marine sediment metagenome TaxID=412755 RepID=A0A0F9RYB0_9ZZZZ